MFAIKSTLGSRGRIRASYSVDQVNHTHFLPAENLLLHASVLPIILFREPEGSIGSMVEVFSRIRRFSVEEATTHYRERVTTLARYATILRRHGCLMALTYDDLVNDTQRSLIRLSDHIGLRTPLADVYSTFPFTGRLRPPTPVFPEAWDPRNIAIVRDVALLLNAMRDAGVVSDYAPFGAAAQMPYTEAVATVDADVLVAGPAPDRLDVPEPTETERLLRRQADWRATASSPPFTVRSTFGQWEAVDQEMLELRVAEVYALDRLSSCWPREPTRSAAGKR